MLPLVRRFLAELCASYGITQEPQITARAVEIAKTHLWPGNVRQLKNAVARTLLKGERLIEALEVDGRTAVLPAGDAAADTVKAEDPSGTPELPVACVSCDFETMQRRYFEALLKETRGRISGPDGAAARAGMHPNTLRSRLERLGLKVGRTVSAERV